MSRMEDLTAVTAFLAMAKREKLTLNARGAEEVWEAHVRLHFSYVPAAKISWLLCKLLGDDAEFLDDT